MPNIPTAQNNPGDLRGQGGMFQTLADPIHGQAALYNDLTAKMTGQSKTGLNGNSTLYEFAQKYAPKGDGNNDPVHYTANLANQMGVNPDTKIGTLMPRIDDFARAVANNEGYKGKWAGPTDTKSGFKSGVHNLPQAADGTQGPSPFIDKDSTQATQHPVHNTVMGAINNNPGVFGLGTGLATSIMENSGQGNQGGDAEAAAMKQLSNIMSKYPPGSPQRKAAIAKYQQLYAGGVPSQADIDPGTTLKNSDVLKSAALTGAAALSGGSIAGEGAESGVISQAPDAAVNRSLLGQTVKGGKGLIGKLIPKSTLGKIGVGLIANHFIKSATHQNILKTLINEAGIIP